jgi:hypothetical protein
MQAVFIRHKLDSSPAILEDLWANRVIAVHYANLPSTDPGDYNRAGRTALTRLWQYCGSGVIVGATYRRIRPAEMVVGEIEQGSRVEAREYDGRIYKVVQLKNAREVSYRDHPLLAAIQPRQVTVTGWPSAQKYLEALLKKGKIPWSVESLAPSQLEVICYEYMRREGLLSALLLPIGRALPDVDICGIDKCGRNVIAQVTHSSSRRTIAHKLKMLKHYRAAGTTLVFFGPGSCRVNAPQVWFIAIEDVFDRLSSDGDSIYHQLISRMLRWD